ncbi:MAG: DUF805 domain-containing protein [Clostridiales bacterium]|nr:DUF805 domain-containing protein [Clostridiales bacterium]
MQDKIGFLRSYGAFWKYYADFSSRTPKEVFWKAWAVHSAVILAVLSPLYYIYHSIVERGDLLASFWIFPLIIYSFATLVPTIAIILRRLHDIDRNGCWIFLYLVPYGGTVAFFIMLSRPSAQYDTFPGLSGHGPYNIAPPGMQPYGQPNGAYANAPPGMQPYGQPNGAYANTPPGGQPYGKERNTYTTAPPGVQPYGRERNTYTITPPGVQPYGQSQDPYSPSYGQLPRSGPAFQQPVPDPYGQVQSRSGPTFQQPVPDPYGQGQSRSGAQPYMQQPYAPPPVFRRTPVPRRFAPLGGGNSAAVAIIVSIALAVTSMVYNFVVNDYLQKNMANYFDSMLNDTIWESFFGEPYDSYGGRGYDYGNGDNYGWDGDEYYGWGDDDYYGWDDEGGWGEDDYGWDYGDGYGHDGDSMYENDYMTDEKLAAIDHVRESTLNGFPDFTIEDVLLAYVNEEGLIWDCNTDDGHEPQDLFVTAFGIAVGSFESVFADFFVYEDGSIALYDLGYGNRWENEKDAMELYAELYAGMVLAGEAA